MEKLARSEIREILDRWISSKTNIPEEQLEEMKDSLTEVIFELGNETIDTYASDEHMASAVDTFFHKLRDRIDPTGSSQIFLMAEIPVILPIELVALCLLIHREFLPAALAKTSEFLITSILAHFFVSVELHKKKDETLSNLMDNVDSRFVN